MQVSDRNADTAPRPHTTKALSVSDSLKVLRTPIRFLKGIGPKRAAQLESIGLRTIEDLLYHLPFRYEDRRQIKKLRAAVIFHGVARSFSRDSSRMKRASSIWCGIAHRLT